jgi:hypothetical protein
VNTFAVSTLCVSTVGAWPETVMVSSRAPTRNSAFTVAVKLALNEIPSRFTVLKPVSEKVTE